MHSRATTAIYKYKIKGDSIQMENTQVELDGACEKAKYTENEALFKKILTEPYKKQDIEEQIILNNMNLVKGIAYKYRNIVRDYDDLIATGYLQLCKCVKSYNLESGVKFGTYATSCINKQMLSFIQSSATILYIPERDARKLNLACIKAKKESIDYDNRDAVREVNNLPKLEYIGDDDFNDVPLTDKRLSTFEDMDFSDWLNIELQNQLTEVEYQVISELFGVNTGIIRSIKDIAYGLHCSETQVRKLRDNALAKLRKVDNLEAELKAFVYDSRRIGGLGI